MKQKSKNKVQRGVYKPINLIILMLSLKSNSVMHQNLDLKINQGQHQNLILKRKYKNNWI